MEQFLYYLLRASILMALFYGFYKLFFGKNTFHNFNRFSLILIVVMVAVLPFFHFNLIPEKKAEPVIENLPMDFSNIPIVEISELPAQPIEIPWIELLSVIFALGFAFAVMRYLIGLNQLIGIIRKSEKQTLADDTVLCITDKDISPFSWMKYIGLSRKDVSADNRAIINHERAHIHLQHSFDMIFLDLFTCVFWFNPFSWLLRREIQSVHEYQADEQVLNNGIDAKQYQLLLIRKSVGEHKFALANNFRQRDLHKRITMMMKNKTNERMKWNYTAALPVLFLAMVALSVPKLNAKVVEEETKETVEINEGFTVVGQVVDKTGKPMMGVKLIKEGENEAIVSDMDGNFVLDTERGVSVSFSMLGYKTQKVTFNKPESNFKVSLEKGEGENKELITVRIAGRDDVNEAVDNQSKLTVSGFVKGKDGFVPGVAVVIKDSNMGTITDPEGKFVIKAGKGDVLRFVMVGYKAFEYEVEKAQDNLVIVLQPDDVVAVGVGSMEDLKGKPSIVVRGTGEKNSNPSIIIRGTGEKKENPLIIIDGKRMPKDFNLDSLNPDEIDSMSVLKDTGAESLYGEDGKNGVIIITTKKLKNGIEFTGKADAGVRIIENDKKPLYIIDGIQATSEKMKELKPDEIESISVLKNDQGTVAMYGEKAKDGVILITTKKEPNVKVEGVQGKVVGVNSEAKESIFSLRGVSEDKKPLIVIDGIVKGKDFELNSVTPAEIESISVLKNKSAVNLYGKDGENGVIVITKKKTNK